MNITGEADEESLAAPPGGVDPQLIESFGAETIIGMSEEILEQEPGAGPPAEAAMPNRYVYTTLRVVNRGNTRGCGYANWSCMTNLCKRDLGTSAWRGWAGCHKSGSSWVCYFECGIVRRTY
jgi:hypothetical protein